MVGGINGIGGIGGVTAYEPLYRVDKVNPVTLQGSEEVTASGKVDPAQCETCNNRKYVDGSNDTNVSFKTPGKISAGESAAKVYAHEREHVSNAVEEGNKENVELLSSSVALKTAICPECGTAYVAGGETRTTLKYSEDNPYDQARKTLEGSIVKGMNVDYAA